MANSVDSGYTQVPVDEHGTNLYVPRQLLNELLDGQKQQPIPYEERSDFFINTLPTGNRTSLQALGNQPSHEVLLDNIKGWPAIAGNAVASRIRGLTKNLHVFSHHIIDGKLEMREQPDHRLSLVLANPNPVFTMGDMLWLLTWHLQQVGEGYWQKITDGIGKTSELWPLPPGNVIPVADEHEGISGYLVKDGKGKEFPLALEEVIRFWNPDPKTLFSAMGRLGPQATEYDQSRFLEDHLKATFEDNATPHLAIVGKADQATIDSDTQRAFYRKWRSLFNNRVGSARSMPAFIPAGWDVKELTTHGAANDVVPLKESNQEQALASYGVPGVVVGMDKNVNRATAEALEWMFDKNTITHYTDLIAEGLTIRLARDFDPKLNVGFADFVAPDKAHVLQQEGQDLDKGVRSVQQVLRDRNEDPGDATWGELPIMPFTLSPYDGDFTVEKRVEKLGTEGLAGGGAAPRLAKPNVTRHSTQSMTRDHPLDVDAAQKRAIAHEKRFTGKLGAAVLRVLKSQELDINERLADLKPEELILAPELADEPRSARDAHTRVVSESIAKLIFDPSEWDEVFAAEVLDHVADAFEAAANDATRTVAQEEFVFSVFAQEAVQTQAFKLAGAVDQTTLRHVADAVQAAVNNAEGIAGVQKRLRPIFNRKRSRTIARTEILTAVQTGQTLGWRETGQVQGKVWHISGNNTRDSHAQTDGQQQPLGAMFTLGSGAQGQNPGDTNLPAGDRVNCQCFLTPVLIEG